jgi:carbonic anhydrase
MLPQRLALSLALALAGCGASPQRAETASAPHQFSYEGDEGPARWGDLSPEFAACKTGTQQSPIDIPAAAPADGSAALEVHPAPQPLHVRNTGHTVQVDATSPSTVTLAGTRYDLVQLHFHSPAEHTLNGARFDAEMHLVHKSAEGKLLVLAVLLKRGMENPALEPLWKVMPDTSSRDPIVIADESLDPSALLPRSGRYVRYDGSLTAPPCTEGVTWLVALPEGTWSTEISDAQIDRFRARMHGATSRPLQPAGARAPRLVVAR